MGVCSGEYCGGREGLKRYQLRAFVESAVQKGIHFGKVSLVPNQMSISWEQVCVAFLCILTLQLFSHFIPYTHIPVMIWMDKVLSFAREKSH